MTNKQGPTQSSNLTSDGEDIRSFDAYDFGLAAALLSAGHELIGLHALECGEHIVFHFLSEPTVSEDAESYWSGKLLINAQYYFYELNNLQARLNGMLHDED
ncbi:MAG: hypothetical protein NTV95_04290 [Candidatus Saccharibacteria bacterium]|nr:hypothetical protein [Candidatus Saccharibacteria bacterium]